MGLIEIDGLHEGGDESGAIDGKIEANSAQAPLHRFPSSSRFHSVRPS